MRLFLDGMNWLKTYISEISKNEDQEWGQTGWRSPANIALVKYWGKKEGQVPLTPSLSFSLTNSCTETILTFRKKTAETKTIDFTFFFEKEKNPLFAQRIGNYLNTLTGEFPFLFDYHLTIESHNSYPHSAGIASSASSMSALALCLCSLEQKIPGIPNRPDFFQRASRIARLGSGSACRSVYGGFSVWGNTHEIINSSDYYALPVKAGIHSNFKNICDAVLIIDPTPKNVSSRSGHELMDNHPSKADRIRQASENLRKLLLTLRTGDFFAFAEVVEAEAVTLHELMKTSSPSFSLLKPETVEVTDRIKACRRKIGLPVCYTLDAGPNVHLIYPEEVRNEVAGFIEKDLSGFCDNGSWIDDRIGKGPQNIDFKV